MGLPIQQLPVFTTTIPSTKKKIKFRGFTVREEKALLLAQESEDVDVIIDAVRQIITSCVTDKIDFDKLTIFDIEFLMTQIRAKSVGEVVTITMPCDADKTHDRISVSFDVSKIAVTIPEGHATTIPLYDDVGVVMKYPSVTELAKVEGATGLDQIAMCIDKIYTADEVFTSEDQTREEPRFEHEISYKCPKCGHEHRKVIRGLPNFFE